MEALLSLFTWLKVALAFGTVIFLHELGHYLAARKNGVRVHKFAIGFDFFGLKLWSKKVGHTEYVIGMLPLGGYVKMLGQDDFAMDEEEGGPPPSDSFQAKSVWQRTQIIAAGVVMNFLTAFALCWGALLIGYQVTPPVVGHVEWRSYDQGLRTGDRILAIGDTRVRDWDELGMAYAMAEAGTTLPVQVLRDGVEQTLQLTIRRNPELPINMPDFGLPSTLQVSPQLDGPADQAGIEYGDFITHVDGIAVRSWDQFALLISERPERAVEITVDRPQEDGSRNPLTVTATTRSRTATFAPQYRLGARPAIPATVDTVISGLAGERAGFREGDEILQIGDQPIRSWLDVYEMAAWQIPAGSTVPVRVRGEDGAERTLTPTFRREARLGMGLWVVDALGLRHEPEAAVIGEIEPDSPAAVAGLMAGDRLTEITVSYPQLLEEDSPIVSRSLAVDDWNQVLNALAVMSEPTLRLAFERLDQQREVEFQLTPIENPHQTGFLGVESARLREPMQRGPLAAVPLAVARPFAMLRQFVHSMVALGRGRVSPKLLSGPVGIVTATRHFAEESFGNLLNWLALLSVNLAVVNFLPIPVTDGGHFMFLMYEKLRGRKMDEEVQARFQWAGLVFLLMLFVFVTYNDIARLITGRL